MAFRSASRWSLVAFAIVSVAACAGNSGSAPASAPAPAAAAKAANALPDGVSPMMVALGDSIFHNGSCKNCHGPDAKGSAKGPDLTDDKWAQIGGSYTEIVGIVTTGVPKDKIKMAGAQFGMNPRGGRPPLTDDQIKAVAAYVYTLSHH